MVTRTGLRLHAFVERSELSHFARLVSNSCEVRETVTIPAALGFRSRGNEGVFAGNEKSWPLARTLRALVFLCAGLCFAPPSLAAVEGTVKPQYLFKLIPFVDWPPSAFDSPAEPFRLCVVGDDPFGEQLEEAGAGQSAGKRPITILRLKQALPDDRCQLMYIAGDPQFVAQSIAAVSGTPVLTVTNAQSETKGVVNFVPGENHIRLEIDQDAALKNPLTVSSKLLSIATPEVTVP
jgi:hypothetical protein